MQCYKHYGNCYENVDIFNVITKYALRKLTYVPLFTLCEVICKQTASLVSKFSIQKDQAL